MVEDNFSVKNELKLGSEEFNFFRAKIFDLAGIHLSDKKKDLVQSRLRTRVIQLEMGSFVEYASYLNKLPPSHMEWESFINFLTTNKTDWLREVDHFTYLENEFLPKWIKLGRNYLSVWCAASSTGEEAYTLSLVLHSALKGTGITYNVIASDIDTKVLKHAQNGVYPRDRIHQIPQRFHSGFAFGTGEISEWMKVKKEIKTPVTFKQVNLTHPLPWNDCFDLVVCRNVLIYFNPQTIKLVINNIFQTAKSDSVLIIAHAESLQNIESLWSYKRPSIYYKGRCFK